MKNSPTEGVPLTGKPQQVFLTVKNAMSTQKNREIHFRKDQQHGDHYRVRLPILLTKSEKDRVIEAISKHLACRKVTIETSTWTKAWLKSTKGTVIRLYPLV